MNKYRVGGVAHIDATVHYFNSAGQVEWYWRLLKAGFWHVAITLHTREGDVYVDPRMAYVSVRRGTTSIGGHEQKVQASVPLSSPPWGVLMPATCVSIVKSILGIRAWWVLTPWQLAKYIEKRRGVLQ